MPDDRFIATGGGASGDVYAAFDDEPMWQHSTVRVVGARREQRVPLGGVDARHAEPGRVLRERDRVAALVGEPAHLLGRLLHVEQREDAARDEALGVRAAPLVDVPVVVRLDHHEVDVAVGALVQHLAGEAGPVREVEPRELAAGRHVAHALVDVVAAGPHVLVAVRVDVEHLGRLARHRVEPEVPAPDVAVVPLLRAVGLVDDPGRSSRYFSGTWPSNMSAGSAMWSSTETRISSSEEVAMRDLLLSRSIGVHRLDNMRRAHFLPTCSPRPR